MIPRPDSPMYPRPPAPAPFTFHEWWWRAEIDLPCGFSLAEAIHRPVECFYYFGA